MASMFVAGVLIPFAGRKSTEKISDGVILAMNCGAIASGS
jgi:hypothetical protein